MMLIGQEMHGQFSPADGRPHHAKPAQAALQAVPIHGIAAEDAGQGPERCAKLAEEQWAFDLFGPARHVGHQVRGPEAISDTVPGENAADQDFLLIRLAVVLELIAVGEVGGKQFGHPPETAVDHLAKLSGVVYDPQIGRFRERQANGTMPSRRTCRDSSGHDPPPSQHHCGSWPVSRFMSAWCRPSPQNP